MIDEFGRYWHKLSTGEADIILVGLPSLKTMDLDLESRHVCEGVMANLNYQQLKELSAFLVEFLRSIE
jgi:hypothetical protein